MGRKGGTQTSYSMRGFKKKGGLRGYGNGLGGRVRRFPIRTKKRTTRRTLKSARSGIWTLKKADEKFSLYIRKRDGRCMHPVGCPVSDIKKLQCSHYINRAHKATRFDPKNVISLCWFHHYKSKEYGLEYHKQTKEKHGFDGWYTTFMRDFIGEHDFITLRQRGIESMKVRRAIEHCMQLLTVVTV